MSSLSVDPRGTFEFYRRKNGDWSWKYRAANGKIKYRASEGYRNKADMLLSIPRCNEVESAFRKEL